MQSRLLAKPPLPMCHASVGYMQPYFGASAGGAVVAGAESVAGGTTVLCAAAFSSAAASWLFCHLDFGSSPGFMRSIAPKFHNAQPATARMIPQIIRFLVAWLSAN